MEQTDHGTSVVKGLGPWGSLALNKAFDALHVFIAMCMSELMMQNAVLGGALYLAGQTWVVYVRLMSKRGAQHLPSSATATAVVVFIGAALLSALLLVVYPALAQNKGLVPLSLCILILLLRQAGSVLLARKTPAPLRVRLCLLLLWHTVLSGLTIFILEPLLDGRDFWILTAMVGGTALGALCYQILDAPPSPAPPPANPDRLEEISAFRVYNRMTMSVFVALNLSIFTYICYLRFQPTQGMLHSFVSLLIWLSCVAGVTILGLWFFRTKRVTLKYDKPSVFVVGALLFSAACVGTYNGWFTGLHNIWNYLLWSVGLACMLSVILALGADMKAVLEFSLQKRVEDYQANTAAMVDWGITLSTLLLVLLFTVTTFFVEGKLDQVDTLLGVQGMMRTLMLLLPLAFVLAALVLALMQPLNKEYASKLMLYWAGQRRGDVNPALYTRLQVTLAQRTRYILPSVVKGILRPLMPCRVIGKERVSLKDGPVVFACNHLEVYGPILSNLHLPFYFRSWVISSMLDRDVVAEQLAGGVDKVFHWLPRGLRKRIPAMIAPLILYVLRSVEPIPVFRGNVREVVKTIKLTVEAMEYEDNILIFPENPEGEGEPGIYKESGVSRFFSGFSSIGSEYYKHTGRATTFYPVYINKKKRTMTIGPGIAFQPENPKAMEKDRIVNALYGWMQAQAGL